MSVASMCVGDLMMVYKLYDDGWGDGTTILAGSNIEGRIDTHSASEDRQALQPDEVRSLAGYFASNPNLSVGMYCKWTESGGSVFNIPRVLRVTGAYHEGRPGSAPMLHVVEFNEMTAIAGEEFMATASDNYYRPNGVDTYFRPGGVDTYLRV